MNQRRFKPKCIAHNHDRPRVQNRYLGGTIDQVRITGKGMNDAAHQVMKIIASASPLQAPPCPRCGSSKIVMCDAETTFTDTPNETVEQRHHNPHPVCLDCGYSGEASNA